jgi:aminoglycoside phosphotransferase (APT) family kinase protein
MQQDKDIRDCLIRAGLIDPADSLRIEALPGGVSGDVFRVVLKDQTVCVKRALPRLRVAKEWSAPVERVQNEAAWIRYAARIEPHCVPEVLAEDKANNLFVMNYFPPDDFPGWKAELRAGKVDVTFAADVGRALANIHAASAKDASAPAMFHNDEIFFALRIEPYLLNTAVAHPDMKQHLHGLAERLASTKIALMHGDISPKNILHGESGPVFLDAETASFGDPAFDLAFCLNHLLLKCIWVPTSIREFCHSFAALKSAYFSRLDWEPAGAFEGRAAQLLSAFLLARIDGKSPVEYIVDDRDKTFVRTLAREFLSRNSQSLDEIRTNWETRVLAR